MKRLLLAFLFPCASVYWLASAAGAELNSASPVYKTQGYLPFADAPIYYGSGDLDDPIARMNKRLADGSLQLSYDSQHAYLPGVLAALGVSVSSQTLVFSKTSFQFPLITPATPRALYFNDDVYVGEVPGAKFLEFVSFDPKKGAVFYVLDAQRTEHPSFERAATDCIQCHVADATKGVPGVMLRSVFTRPSGYPAGGARSFVTGHESPWNERWGGWYVTAHRSLEPDLSNALVQASDKPEHLTKFQEDPIASQAAVLRKASYLSESSDVVALMVLAHQTQMHNLITLTSYQARLGTAKGGQVGFEKAADQMVRYLLFANESPLKDDIEGDTTFAADFAARGPFDSHGRSLRQFDLKKRLFRYPCSYLIYSETFDALPEQAKSYVFRRLFEVLTSKDQGVDFQALTNKDRRAVLEILVETKPGLPPEWKRFLNEPVNRQTAVASDAPR